MAQAIAFGACRKHRGTTVIMTAAPAPSAASWRNGMVPAGWVTGGVAAVSVRGCGARVAVVAGWAGGGAADGGADSTGLLVTNRSPPITQGDGS